MNAFAQFLVAIFLASGPVSADNIGSNSFLAEEGVQPNEAVQAAREAFALLGSDPEKAARKAKEARELLDDGASPGLKAELDLLLDLAEFRADPGGSRARDLERTLTKRNEDGIGDSALTAQSWLDLAGYAMRNQDWNTLARCGAAADKAIAAVEPGNYDIRSVAIGLEGIGRLRDALENMKGKQTGSRIGGTGKWDVSDLEEAIETFERGIVLFPPQPSLTNFNQNLANLIAWRHAASAVLRSWDVRQAEAFESKEERVKDPWPPRPVPGGCSAEWKRRSEPDFPDTARMFNYAGSAIVVYDLSRDGEVRNARVLAEVPTEMFGPAVVEAMKDWRAEIPASLPEACLWEHILTYEFYFR